MKKLTSAQIDFFIFLGLFLLGVLLYTQILHSPFQLDDNGPALLQNYTLRQFPNVGIIWEHGGKARFLTSLTFAINYYLHSDRVFGYHVFNLALHILNSLLLFLFIKTTLQSSALKINMDSRMFAAFAALLFLTHPIQTAAVTYIVQRSVLLAAFFYLLTLLAYAQWQLTSKRAYYFISVVTCVMAMFTKEIAFTLPLMIILYDRMFWRSKPAETIARPYGVLPFLLSLLIIPVILYAGDSGTFSTAHLLPAEINSISRSSYFFSQLNVLCTYLRLLFFPVNQNLDYDYLVSSTLWTGHTLFSALFLGGVLITGIYLRKTERLTAFTIFWFFLTLSVESSFIPIRDLIFEHRLYLPMVGFAIIVPVFLDTYLFNRKNQVVAFLVILCLLSSATWHRNQVWKSSLTLWQDVIKKSPRKGRAYHGLAFYYQNQRGFDQAIQYTEKAIELDGNNPLYYFTLAINYGFKGNTTKKIELLRQALALNPYAPAKYYRHLGLAYTSQGQYDEAISEFKKAIELNSLYPPAYYGLGVAYEARGDIDEAMRKYQEAIDLDPSQAEAYNNLGVLYAKKGNLQKALVLAHKAIHLNPHSAEAYNNLATTYSRLNASPDQLIPIYEQAIQECPFYQAAYTNLTHAYIQKGDYKRAEEIRRKGLILAEEQKKIKAS